VPFCVKQNPEKTSMEFFGDENRKCDVRFSSFSNRLGDRKTAMHPCLAETSE
jgi:hypothetical protein